MGGEASFEALCILPWIHLEVVPEGACKPCNVAKEPIRDGGVFMNVAATSLQDIRSSRYLRTMRMALASGSRLPVCSYCWEQERRGETSLRQTWNGQFAPALETLKQRLSEGADPGEPMPAQYVQLSLGNQCHLACRMCNGTYSSRIEADPVHGRWAPSFDRKSEIVWAEFEDAEPGSAREERRTGWIAGTPWFEQPEFDRDMTDVARTLSRLYVTGGDPLSTASFYRILDNCVAAGRADHVELVVNTSLFHSPDRIERAMRSILRFERCHLAPSVDGIGAVYEYIRYPARWSVVEGNLRRVQALTREHGKLRVQISTVVQAYNCLDLVEILELADELAIACFMHVLDDPPQLRPCVLPRELRARAADRLRAYAGSPGESRASTRNRDQAERIAGYLESLEDGPEVEGLRQAFVAFTRELDASRGQSLERSIPGLARLMRRGA